MFYKLKSLLKVLFAVGLFKNYVTEVTVAFKNPTDDDPRIETRVGV
jgi:hypothetical protein